MTKAIDHIVKNINVRVNRRLWARFKRVCAERDLTLRTGIVEAIDFWIRKGGE